MPSTLRSRLIIAFSFTIFLSLILAGTATIYLLRAERERTAQEKIGRLAPLVGLQEAMLEARGITNPTAIQQNLGLNRNTDSKISGKNANTQGVANGR